MGWWSSGYFAYVAFINGSMYCLVNTDRKSISWGNSTVLRFRSALLFSHSLHLPFLCHICWIFGGQTELRIVSSWRSVGNTSKTVLRRNHQSETKIYFIMLTQTLPNYTNQLDEDLKARFKSRLFSWTFQSKLGIWLHELLSLFVSYVLNLSIP